MAYHVSRRDATDLRTVMTHNIFVINLRIINELLPIHMININIIIQPDLLQALIND